MATTKVNTEFIAVNAISGTIIADNAITATHIATNAISGTLVQNGGIVTTMIAANNITSTKIVTDAVLTRHIADDQVTEAKLANAINTSIAAKLPLAGGTMTGTIAGFTSTGIDDNADATAITIDSSENVTITGDLIVTGGQINTGNTAGDHSEFGTDGSGHTFIDASTSGGVMKFQTAGTDRHQIGSTGKASWSAGGAGTVTTQSRDFTFYTEGGSNGVDIRSNDYQIAFIGGAGSSGAGMDKGYMQLCVDGSAKIAFNTNGDSYFTGGKLLIGDSGSHTDDLLQIETPASGGGHGIQIRRNDSNNDQGIGRIQFGNNDDVDIVRIQAVTDGATDSGRISFHTSATGATSTERMRINSAGRIQCQGTESGSSGALNLLGEVGNSYDAIQFYHNSSTLVGRIRTASGSTSYNTSSDYRLKENVDYTWDATTRLKQLKPARFNFTADDTNTLVDGFLAHEVSSIVPEAITGEKDAVDSDGNPDYQGIDQSKLVPLLVKTVQELEARIKTLEG